MKKSKISLLVIMAILMNSIIGYANSGPVTWFQYPDISVVTVDEDTSIAVTKEELSFDFSDDTHADYSLEGKVSAKYEMKNTGESNINSRMVFPYIKNIWGIQADEVQVLVDGVPIEYSIHYGDTVGSISSDGEYKTSIELKDILTSITDDRYMPQNFEYEEKGTLYRLHFESNREERMYAVVDFSTNMNSSRLLIKGNNSYAYDSKINAFSVGAGFNSESHVIEIYSFDENLDLDIKGYESGAMDADEITDFTVNVERVEVSIEAYLLEYIDSDIDLNSDAVYYKALDQALERTPFINEDDISSLLIAPRYVLIAYEVPFDAQEERTVEIRYSTLGSMDRRETVNPTFTYHYFLHPAKYWEAFQNLTIRITPSETYPFVLNSNLPLTRDSDGTYVGSFETLPETDFEFTLYEKEEVSVADKFTNVLDKNMYLLLFIGFAILCVLSLLIFVWLIRKLLKLYNNRNLRK